MGVLNVTPDSFSDGGLYLHPKKALARARRIESEGADLIDVGGESTRPGARRVSVEEEKKRVLPVIEKLHSRLKISISIDTSKPQVAKAAIQAGANLVNDITALRDPRMREVVAHSGVPIILMHMRGTPRTMQKNPSYRRLIPEVLAELKEAIRRAREGGIAKEKILIDPGLGFGKRPEDNFLLLKNLSSLKALGFPVVVGPSRKSFIGLALGGAPPQERLFGTAAAVALSVIHGADVIRVHDVAAMRQVVAVAAAIGGRTINPSWRMAAAIQNASSS
jgi:dihydropteroate synthase